MFGPSSSCRESPEFIIEIDHVSRDSGQPEAARISKTITETLAIPTQNLLDSMKCALQSCDAVLMDMCGHRHHLGPPYNISSDTRTALIDLQTQINAFSNQQEGIIVSNRLTDSYSKFHDVIKVLAFSLSLHQAARSIESLVTQINDLHERRPRHSRFHLPSYPFWKAIYRTNAQVRHDKGGVNAGKIL